MYGASCYVYSFLVLCIVAPAFSYNCEDQVPDCKQYGKQVCTDPQYFRWAYDYCPKFCEMCRYFDQDRITYPPRTTVSCLDVYPYCQIYLPKCSDSRFSDWINAHCRKTCGICESNQGTTTGHGVFLG